VHADVVEHVVVVAPRIALGGRVVDEAGAPLGAAKVRIEPRADLRASIQRVLDAALFVDWTAVSDDRGEFELPEAPAMDGASLVVELEGYDSERVQLPPASDLALEIALRRHAPTTRHLIGRVVDERGEPVEGALVALLEVEGLQTARTNSLGAFDLTLEPGAASATTLCAVKPGRLPAELVRGGDSALDPAAWPEPLVLELSGAPLSIEGRVVGADGQPVPGAQLIALDGRRFGLTEQDFGGTRFWIEADVESVLRGTVFGDRLVAGADGRFEVLGLLPRSYRFQVFDPRTLASAVTPPLEAGRRGVEVWLPLAETWPRIAGVVVDRHGGPVAGASIWLSGEGEERGEASAHGGPATLIGARVTSDEEGRFRIDGAARAATSIGVQAPELPTIVRRSLAEEPDVGDLRIVVSRRVHAQVDLTDSPLQAETVMFVDDRGEPVQAIARHGEVSFGADRVALVERRSEVLSVPDAAAELVLLDRDQREVARVPVALKAGELNLIRP
jgi:protocatechuate 3,4-dioxygenase beta subunit